MFGWTLHGQQQQKGTQFQSQGRPEAARDGLPEAVRDRSAQDHESAKDDAAPGKEPEPGAYPASRMVDGDEDNVPNAPAETKIDWDDIVQPERAVQTGDREADRRRRQASAPDASASQGDS